MATITDTEQTTLLGLQQNFQRQLSSLNASDSAFILSQNVILRLRVPIPNPSIADEQAENECEQEDQRQQSYVTVNVEIIAELFLGAERECLTWGGGVTDEGIKRSELITDVREAIGTVTGVGLEIQDDGSWWSKDFDDREPLGEVEVLSVQMVPREGINDTRIPLAGSGYCMRVEEPEEEESSERQRSPTISPQSLDPRWLLGSHQLRGFLPADYTIYLITDYMGKDVIEDQSVAAFHINRFLLGLRVPYFRNMFSSGMADSETNSSTLYTDTFTPEALTIICRYIYLITPRDGEFYHPDTRDLFWYCGLSGQSDEEDEALLRKLKSYIYPEMTDIMESILSHSKPKPTTCADYLRLTESDGSAPPVSILTHLIDVIKAAEYLGIDDLKSYITHILTLLAHNFQCYGLGCAVFLPKMLDKVYHETIVPRFVLKNLVKMLGQTKSTQQLWKRSLIMMTPEAISYLLSHMQNRILNDPVIKRTHEGGGIRAAFVLYVALAKLHRQVRGKSRDADLWEVKILHPLMNDFLTKLLASDLRWCEYLVSRGSTGLDTDITRGLVWDITSRYMSRENCEKIWRLVSDHELEFWDEEAMKPVIEWFKKEWLSLSITPPEPDPRTSARPVGAAAAGSDSSGGTPQMKVPRMKEAYEPNFFATWDRRGLEILGREINVDVEDLLAQGHKAGLPPRTPRRNGGTDESGMGEGAKRREGEVGRAVIPPVGAGGGRTGQNGGATLVGGPGEGAEGESEGRDEVEGIIHGLLNYRRPLTTTPTRGRGSHVSTSSTSTRGGVPGRGSRPVPATTAVSSTRGRGIVSPPNFLGTPGTPNRAATSRDRDRERERETAASLAFWNR